MARSVTKAPPRLSLFDRLLQGDSIETDRNVERAMREVREGVKRDLEILLNSRPRFLPLDPELEELRVSVLSFGLAELQGRHIATPAQQQQLAALVESLIVRFEPRLRDPSVELVATEGKIAPALQLRIHAMLQIDQTTEAVVFDTSINPMTGGVVVFNR